MKKPFKKALVTLTLLGITFAYFNALKLSEAEVMELTEKELIHYGR